MLFCSSISHIFCSHGMCQSHSITIVHSMCEWVVSHTYPSCTAYFSPTGRRVHYPRRPLAQDDLPIQQAEKPKPCVFEVIAIHSRNNNIRIIQGTIEKSQFTVYYSAIDTSMYIHTSIFMYIYIYVYMYTLMGII